MIVFVMGICGSGKSTVGRNLATELGCAFFDGDDYHSADNRAKMASGVPLTDADRQPWLERLSLLAQESERSGSSAVIACSALKQSYRNILRQGLSDDYYFVFLDITREQAIERLVQREAHYMKANMVDSQLASLEVPDSINDQRVIAVDATLAPRDVIMTIVSRLK